MVLGFGQHRFDVAARFKSRAFEQSTTGNYFTALVFQIPQGTLVILYCFRADQWPDVVVLIQRAADAQ